MWINGTVVKRKRVCKLCGKVLVKDTPIIEGSAVYTSNRAWCIPCVQKEIGLAYWHIGVKNDTSTL